MSVRPAKKSFDLTNSAPHKNPDVYHLYENKFEFQVGATCNSRTSGATEAATLDTELRPPD